MPRELEALDGSICEDNRRAGEKLSRQLGIRCRCGRRWELLPFSFSLCLAVGEDAVPPRLGTARLSRSLRARALGTRYIRPCSYVGIKLIMSLPWSTESRDMKAFLGRIPFCAGFGRGMVRRSRGRMGKSRTSVSVAMSSVPHYQCCLAGSVGHFRQHPGSSP